MMALPLITMTSDFLLPQTLLTQGTELARNMLVLVMSPSKTAPWHLSIIRIIPLFLSDKPYHAQASTWLQSCGINHNVLLFSVLMPRRGCFSITPRWTGQRQLAPTFVGKGQEGYKLVGDHVSVLPVILRRATWSPTNMCYAWYAPHEGCRDEPSSHRWG